MRGDMIVIDMKREVHVLIIMDLIFTNIIYYIRLHVKCQRPTYKATHYIPTTRADLAVVPLPVGCRVAPGSETQTARVAAVVEQL